MIFIIHGSLISVNTSCFKDVIAQIFTFFSLRIFLFSIWNKCRAHVSLNVSYSANKKINFKKIFTLSQPKQRELFNNSLLKTTKFNWVQLILIESTLKTFIPFELYASVLFFFFSFCLFLSRTLSISINQSNLILNYLLTIQFKIIKKT